jgi:hypothetical protein
MNSFELQQSIKRFLDNIQIKKYVFIRIPVDE